MPALDAGRSWAKRNPSKVRAYKKRYRIESRDRYRAGRKALVVLKRQWLASYKEAVGCKDCSHKFPSFVLDFDHRDSDRKFKNVSRLVLYGWDVLKREMAKCDVVCANCHRIRTHVRRMREAGDRKVVLTAA